MPSLQIQERPSNAFLALRLQSFRSVRVIFKVFLDFQLLFFQSLTVERQGDFLFLCVNSIQIVWGRVGNLFLPVMKALFPRI